MIYVGIDPGERWCGFAALEILSSGTVRVEARTYVMPPLGYVFMTKQILDLLPHARRTLVIVEDFQIRRAGHQRFNRGDTLRFLGALEYGVKGIDQFEFMLIPPTDKIERITNEMFGRVLSRYRERWPNPRHSAWRHCLSAWRVLGQHVAFDNPSLRARLIKQKKSLHSERWLPIGSNHFDNCIAPAALWIK